MSPKGGEYVEIRIVGKPKEIAALVTAIQGQRMGLPNLYVISDEDITLIAQAIFKEQQNPQDWSM